MAVEQPNAAPDAPESAANDLLRKRKLEDADMDITPMIDITFLLLIFFLVAAKMEDAADVPLPPARHGGPVAAKDAIVVVVKEGGDDAVVQRGDGTPFSADLEKQEEEIGGYVEAGIAGTAPFDAPKHHIMIKASKGVKHREVARVAEAIGKAAGEEMPILHIAVLETN